MKWHQYTSEILESEGGLFRIYRGRRKDRTFRYTLHQLHESVMTKLGEFDNAAQAQETAEDYLP